MILLECLLHVVEDGSVSPPSETSEDTTSSEEAHSPKMTDVTETEGAGENAPAAGSGDQAENVLVIDTTFTCQIVAPGMDPFEIKVRFKSPLNYKGW